MKKLSLLMLATALSLLTAHAQTLTYINQTGCDVMIYSGMVNVNGTTYSFGSETPSDGSIVPADDAIRFTIANPPPATQVTLINYSGLNSGTTSYIMFKYRLPNVASPYEGVGFIEATNPISTSGPTPPGGCNSGNPYTLKWTGTADNPAIFILS